MWEMIANNYTLFLRGLGVTLLLAVVGTVGGFFLSLLLVAAKTAKIDKKRDTTPQKGIKVFFSSLVTLYITIFRGTPMMLQAMVFFWGLPQLLGIALPALTAGLIVVTLNTTAYVAEILRGSVNAIDKGQMEAARSLGFSRGKALILFVYPQAVKNAIPSMGNEFIVNLKDTAVLSVIGVVDIFQAGNLVFGQTFNISVFIIAALMYLFITTITTLLVHVMEKVIHKEVSLSV